MNPKQNNVVYIFKDVDSAQIDYLHYLIPQHRARFINCQGMLIRSVTIEGTLQECIELDDQSHVRFDLVSTRFDAGMLDDPRLSIGALYCRPARTRIELPLGEPVVKLLPPANARGAGDWDARWDTGQGVIRGSLRMEETGAARRMRVEVTENAHKRPLLIEVPLPDHEDLLGKRCIVTWRIDGPGEAFVDHNDKQFPSRVRNSLTANVLPTPLKSGDKLLFWLPPEPGVYHVWQVALYAP
jgi:hypothetical protein